MLGPQRKLSIRALLLSSTSHRAIVHWFNGTLGTFVQTYRMGARADG